MLQRRNDFAAGVGCLVVVSGSIVFWSLVAYAGGWRAVTAAAVVVVAGTFALACWERDDQ